MRGLLVRMLAVTMLAAWGCEGDGYKTATQLQVAEIEAMKLRSRAYEQNMKDNALLADMSLAEYHFIPHSDELSGSGVARLDRMAILLDTYGGTVWYEARIRDEDLIKQRIEHVREYLAMTGCNVDRVKIETGLAGGEGMMASRALEKQDKMDNPTGQGGGMMPMLGGSQGP